MPNVLSHTRRRWPWLWTLLALLFVAALVSTVARPAQAAGTVVVKPSALNGWALAPESPPQPTGVGSFVSGPATPPLGSGSVQFTVDSTGSYLLGTAAFNGTRLDQITRLEYSTYRASGGAALAPALQFNVDYNLTDANTAWQGRLVFEPYLAGTVNTGVWQTWNALNGPASGYWWSSGAPGNGVCPQANPCTTAEVLAAFPNAGIHSTLGALLFKAGSGWSGGFVGNVDAFVIGIAGDETTFDFEAEAQCTTTCYVNTATGNDSFGGDTPATAKKTIQAALNQVSPGGTVIVAPGSYAEAVSITKSGVRLQGAGAGTDPAVHTIIAGPVGGSSGISLPNSGTTGVTITGLRVQGFTNGGICSVGTGNNNLTIDAVQVVGNTAGSCQGGIYVNGPVADVLITNSLADGNTTRGIVVWNGFKQRITITNNTVTNNNCCGIELQDGTASGVTVTGNTVTGNADSGMSFIGLMAGAGPNLIANNTLTDNGRFGIEIKLPNGTGAETGDGSIVVRDNTVRRITPIEVQRPSELRDLAGIAVYRRGYVVGNNNVDIPTGVVVKNNSVNGYIQSNPGSASEGFGIVVEGTNMRVLNNIVTANDVGIQIQQGHTPYTANSAIDGDQSNLADQFFGRGNAPASSGTIGYNSVTGNSVGIRNVGVAAASATATCNWWGDISGPSSAGNPGGLGQPHGGSGVFAPWLVYSTDADGVAPGLQLPTAFTVSAGADTSLADNGYRRLANAVGCVQSGQTVTLSGSFDWAGANAAADWALGSDKTNGTGDDWSALVPRGISDVTVTAANLGAATVQGPGDLAAADLETFLYFDGGPNQRWTISNLQVYDIDLAIGMFGGAGGATAYNGTVIRDNAIRLPTDLNATVAPADVLQNIGIHFAFGTNQTIANNLIEIPGNGVSDTANGNRAASVGMQSNTSGGAVYDGLQITGNTLRVLNAQSADPETVLGIWENSHGHTSNIVVSGNQFVNLAAGNNPALNAQRAFRITSHSSATTSVRYEGNSVAGANTGFQWLSGQNFAGNQPVVLRGNTLTDVSTGVRLDSNGLATLEGNSFATSLAGASIGLDAPAGTSATLAASPAANSLTGFGTGISAAGTVAIGDGTSISGGTTGLLVNAATSVTLGSTAFGGQMGDYITLVNYPTDLDGRTSTFEGVPGANLDAAQYAAAQAKITDKNDNPALGLVLLSGPRLTVSPTTLSFNAVAGAASPAAQSFAVGNTPAANEALDWSVSAPTYDPAAGGWLTCAPTSGTGLAPGGSAPVSCQPDSLPLAPGVYTATLDVSSVTKGVVGSPQTVTATLSVAPLGISLAPGGQTVPTGATGTLSVTIDAVQQNDTVITLASANPAVASVPATVTIPAGQLAVSFPVAGVAAGGPVAITATLPGALGGASASADVTVATVGLTLTPALSTIPVGGAGTLTVAISPAQGSDTTVALSSSLPGVVGVPATVVIPANTTSATVQVTGSATGGPATITATLPAALGGGTATAQVTVATVGITLTPASSTITVGASATLTVTISPAQSGNTTVTLASSLPGVASAPASVVIPAGQTSATLQVAGLAAGGPATITATLPQALGGGAATAQVTVVAAPPPPPPTGYTVLLPIVQKAAVVSQADLIVTSISVSPNKSSFAAGEQVVVTVVVKNQGTAPANPFWVDLYINPSSVPTTANILWNRVCGITPCFGIAWSVPGGLGPGESVTLTSQSVAAGQSIWLGWLAQGTTSLHVYADSWDGGVGNPSGAVAESNEANNSAALSGLTVTGSNPPLNNLSRVDRIDGR